MKKLNLETIEYDLSQPALIWSDCGLTSPIVAVASSVEPPWRINCLQLAGLTKAAFLEELKEFGFSEPSERTASPLDYDAWVETKLLLRLTFPTWTKVLLGRMIEVEFRHDQTVVRYDGEPLGFASFKL